LADLIRPATFCIWCKSRTSLPRNDQFIRK